MYKVNHSTNAVFSLCYHLIIVTKYRRKVFNSTEIVEFLKKQIETISDNFKIELVEQGVDQDHIHILFRAKPTTDLIKYVNAIKTNTSRLIRRDFKDQIEDKLWGDHFWSPSYFLATTGNVTLEVVKRYVENQGVRGMRRDEKTEKL